MEKQFIKYFEIRNNLDTNFLEEIHLSLEKVTMKKGEFYLCEGNVCKNIGFVEKGMLRIFNVVDGEVKTRWVILAPEVVTSISSFITQSKSVENIQAIEPTILFQISYQKFQSLYKKHSALRELWTVELQNYIIGMEARLLSMLNNSAEERYLTFTKNYPKLAERIPLKDLSSILGISPQHLSRIRRL